MAILKAGRSGQNLTRAIAYAAKDAMQEKDLALAGGVNCPDVPQEAIESMGDTKNFYHKLEGRQYKPYIQSFAKGEVAPGLANQIGREWAEKCFPENECFVGTHVNSASGVIHNHIIVNSVNFVDGRKIQVSKADLEKMKNINDEVCHTHGLSVVDRSREAVQRRARMQAWSQEKYRTVLQPGSFDKKSYVAEAAKALQTVLEREKPGSREAFCAAMRRKGFEVNFRGIKHITFCDRNGNKVRASNLAKTYAKPNWTRIGIESEIAKNYNRAPLYRDYTERENKKTVMAIHKQFAGIEKSVQQKEKMLTRFIQQNRKRRSVRLNPNRFRRIGANLRGIKMSAKALKAFIKAAKVAIKVVYNTLNLVTGKHLPSANLSKDLHDLGDMITQKGGLGKNSKIPQTLERPKQLNRGGKSGGQEKKQKQNPVKQFIRLITKITRTTVALQAQIDDARNIDLSGLNPLDRKVEIDKRIRREEERGL